MKLKPNQTGVLVLLVLAATINLQLATLHAQGTAFTYQGRLNAGGTPANGYYDLMVTVAPNSSGFFIPLAPPITNSATWVTNGLFMVTLDFGTGVFNGNARWLQVAARTNGAASFITLSPRQPLTPAPEAIVAGDLSGTLAANRLTGSLRWSNG